MKKFIARIKKTGANMNSLNRALNILSYIASCRNPIAPTEISRQLGIPLSTVYRLLYILIKWEFVTYAEQYGTYSIGAQSIKIQEQYRHHSLLLKSSHSELRALAKTTQETVAIITSTFSETICVDMIESERTLRCSFVIGQRNTLIKGASAKTLLAFRDKEYQSLVFKTHQKQLSDVKTKNQLLAELAIIRNQGYGTSVGEIDSGVLGVAAPIFKRREIIAVLSAMAPEFRVLHDLDSFISQTCQAARNINKFINQE